MGRMGEVVSKVGLWCLEVERRNREDRSMGIYVKFLWGGSLTGSRWSIFLFLPEGACINGRCIKYSLCFIKIRS